MKIYIDSDYKCHIAPGDGLTEVQSSFFDGMAPDYVEGFRFVPDGETWTREDGATFNGEMISAWKDWDSLNAIQHTYNTQQVAELESALTDIEEALGL